MDAILGVVSHLGNPRYEEDIVDRWNYQLTAYIFSFSAVLITSYTYMGQAIKCWTPAEFRGGWIEYTRDFCLIENTYYVAIDDPDMPNHYKREEEEIPYYQWVQFVLVILALFWYLPHLFWRTFNWWSGIQVRAIVSACAKLPADEAEREKKLDQVVDHVYRCAFDTKKVNKSAASLTILYFLMKAFFLLNIVVQVVILHIFLGFDWGDLFSLKLGFNTDWKATGLFPRTTMCDFSIRNKGNLQRYSVQCVLAQNMFNEKIFLVLFYWIIALFIATVINTVLWFRQIFFRESRVDYAERMLASAGVKRPEVSEDQHKALNEWESFVSLSRDSVVLLRLVASNAGDVVASQLIQKLFVRYQKKE